MGKVIEVKVITRVDNRFAEVRRLFSQSLLEKLNPPFPVARIVRYDGESVNDEVWISLHFILFKQVWKSRIISNEEHSQHFFFVDQGEQLPFFLKSWQHTHGLRSVNHGRSTEIIDALRFTTPWWLPEFIAKPLFTGLMRYRRPLYQKHLGLALVV